MTTKAATSPTYLPCIVLLIGPSGTDLEMANVGGGTYAYPFGATAGAALVGSNQVCTKAQAEEQLAQITEDCGLPFNLPLTPSSAYKYLAVDPEITGSELIFGTDEDDVNIYIAVSKDGVTRADSIQELIVAQNEAAPGAKWTYAPIPGSSDKAPQLIPPAKP